MNPTISPYQYFFIKKQVEYLLNVYTSVNDQKTVETVQAKTVENIMELLPDKNQQVTDFIDEVLDTRMTKAKAERQLETIKDLVTPFQAPSKLQLTKLFKKVKKLKIPNWSEIDLREQTYVGWNDAGTQRKFMIYYEENQLKGIYGSLSPTVMKGICPICKKTSNVSLFLATTKSNSDGTYTKKGNYICHDSIQCNQQLIKIEEFEKFVETIR